MVERERDDMSTVLTFDDADAAARAGADELVTLSAAAAPVTRS